MKMDATVISQQYTDFHWHGTGVQMRKEQFHVVNATERVSALCDSTNPNNTKINTYINRYFL